LEASNVQLHSLQQKLLDSKKTYDAALMELKTKDELVRQGKLDVDVVIYLKRRWRN
jgi:hypothetical protein